MRAALVALVLAFAAPAGAEEKDCALAPPDAAKLAPLESVTEYASVLRKCAKGDESAIAVREMKVRGEPALLLADPEKLTTRLEKASCWSQCAEVEESQLADTRMMKAIDKSAAPPPLEKRGFLQNAGLTHGQGEGSYLTGDLCPSARPLDRAFLEKLAPGTPIALSISGLWLDHHFADFRWLQDRQASGALDILWTNHSFHHQYVRGVPSEHNFLLSPGVDADEEILDAERLLIANGGTPSLFFRFPGLISSAPLMQAARRHHLITLGADAWLALQQKPTSGSIVLVHVNGNEPSGLKLYERDEKAGAISKPLRPLVEAPE